MFITKIMLYICSVNKNKNYNNNLKTKIMKIEINKSLEGLEKTFNFNENTFAISQCGEDYNGTLTLWLHKYSEFIEWHFCCYEDSSENYCSREEALGRLIQKAKDL